MGKLLKVTKLDIESVKKLYEFILASNPKWEETRKLMIKMGLKQPVEDEEKLSGFALFYKTIGGSSLGTTGEYLFLEEEVPVVDLRVDYYSDANITDVSYVTRKDQMHRGYATAALNEMCQYIFANTNVEYVRLTIIPMSSLYSKNVALKNGFEAAGPNEYRKKNPNYIQKL
ncbi:MAG TPA: GNAT family N-acetyltransferase [Bacilli bacterium]|nr:GNAT family N-acetyltransferase [Bacilli bacterium]